MHCLFHHMQRVIAHGIGAARSLVSKHTTNCNLSKQSGPKVTTGSRVYPWRDHKKLTVSYRLWAAVMIAYPASDHTGTSPLLPHLIFAIAIVTHEW